VGDVSPVTYPANPATRVNISVSGQQALHTAPGALAKRMRELELLKLENDIWGERLANDKRAVEIERQRKKRQIIDFCNSIGINPKGKF
jgi:hypothetical protein